MQYLAYFALNTAFILSPSHYGNISTDDIIDYKSGNVWRKWIVIPDKDLHTENKDV